ncbi:hypothetical protein AX14_002760 [Amanita brunnescens Koide BX004]|nr:hypothetical protein AX14_002760 [Amanita brunnescens Koide BX004]
MYITTERRKAYIYASSARTSLRRTGVSNLLKNCQTHRLVFADCLAKTTPPPLYIYYNTYSRPAYLSSAIHCIDIVSYPAAACTTTPPTAIVPLVIGPPSLSPYQDQKPSPGRALRNLPSVLRPSELRRVGLGIKTEGITRIRCSRWLSNDEQNATGRRECPSRHRGVAQSASGQLGI